MVSVSYIPSHGGIVMQKKHDEKVMESQTLMSDPEWSWIELEE